MTAEHLPFVTFIVPTYNEEKNIIPCIRSILWQNYPTDKLEILIIDGMSSDRTVELASKYPVKIIKNIKRVIPEACNLGVKHAKGEFLSFMGADSELPQTNWVQLMIASVEGENNVAGAIPILRPYRKYPGISRFFSLMQADPIIVFAYGSGLDIKDGYITEENYFPMGISLIRKNLLDETSFKSSLTRSEDVDFTYQLIKRGYKFAVVREAGLYHLYVSSFSAFLRKTNARIKNFVKSFSLCGFSYVPQKGTKNRFLYNLLFDASGVGIFKRIVKGVKRDNDWAWLYYPAVLYSTLMFYAVAFLSSEEGRNLFKEFVAKPRK